MLTAGLLGGGWLWLRDSSLVAVNRVTVTGLSGPTADAIRSALVDSARQMTTLHVRVSRLRAAVADYGIVRDIRVHTDFPHGLRIQVLERHPVAAIQIDGRRLAVTADGTMLPGVAVPDHGPAIPVAHPQAGARLTDHRALQFLALLGAAPTPLRDLVSRVYVGPGGITAQLRSGPDLYFGDSARVAAKWIAAARVLADPSSNGARYIDLRIPDRPVAAVPNAQALFQAAMAGVLPGGTAGTGAGAGTGAPGAVAAAQPPGAAPTASQVATPTGPGAPSSAGAGAPSGPGPTPVSPSAAGSAGGTSPGTSPAGGG